MAENLYLKDGSTAVLLREDSFARLVGEYMGSCAEQHVRELEDAAAKTVQDAKDEIDSESGVGFSIQCETCATYGAA